MAYLPESETWEDGIYQLELVDPVVGGVNGISNRQAMQLGNRTKYLKGRVDENSDAISDLNDEVTEEFERVDEKIDDNASEITRVENKEDAKPTIIVGTEEPTSAIGKNGDLYLIYEE